MPGLPAEDEAKQRRRLEYLGFTEDDAARLAAIGHAVADLIDVAVERFYAHLMGYEVRSLIQDPRVLERLKGYQRQYLLDLFGGHYGAAYFQSRLRIGETHVRIGLEPQWFLGMYGIYRACFLPRIIERFASLPDGGAAHMLSFDKVMLLDSELALDAYIHAFTRNLRELQQQVSDRNRELEGNSARLEELVAERAQELRLSEEKYRGIVDHAADAIVLIDNDEVVRSWNRGATEMFGYAADEILGQSIDRLMPEGTGAEREHIRGEVARAGVLKNFEATRLAKDGRAVSVSITHTLLRNESGSPMGSSLILRDITAIRAFEERMYRAERLASLGWLASEIAHEVGTPLNVISGRAEHLLKGLPEGDAKRRALEIIVTQSDRISRVMRRALQIVRDPGEIAGEAHSCRVVEACQEVLEFFDVKLISRRISLVRDIAPLDLAVNRLDLEQILFNLIQNSLDAMPAGGTLTIVAHPRGEEAVLSVVDTGLGIDPENLERIFEPLFTTKESGQGTGLGLALVSRILRRYRGTIEVESRRGAGCTFRMRLPLAGAPAGT